MKISVLFLMALLGGCSASSGNNTQTPVAETLYGYRWQANILFVDVISHGCTKVKDFSLQWRNADTLVLIRNKPDRCRKAAKIKTLNFETQRRSGQQVQIINPVQALRIKQFAH